MAKTRVKRTPKANPDIFDVVDGVTEDDLELTDKYIERTKQDIKHLMHRQKLLVLQRTAQQIAITGETSAAAEMLVVASYEITKRKQGAGQEPAQATCNPD